MGYCGPANDSRSRRQSAHVRTGARRELQPALKSSGLGVPSYGTMRCHSGVPKQRREPPTGSHGRGLAARASGGYREGSLVPCCHWRQSSVPPSRYAVPRATSILPFAGQGSTARRSLSIPSCVGQPAGPQIQGVARPVGRYGTWITDSILAEARDRNQVGGLEHSGISTMSLLDLPQFAQAAAKVTENHYQMAFRAQVTRGRPAATSHQG